ncbi:somatostatin receptor type 1-like [Watersipora subatra]|uniref:somatostatin receptor type 1-like n=1 Tax=Watersipora subatra TaxID=2589382 RepID=UPI00355AF4F1
MEGISNSTKELVPYRTVALVSSYFILVTIVGVVLNLLTVFTLALGCNISKEVKIQLINLAIADVIMAAFFPTTMMSDNVFYFPFKGTLSWCAISFCIAISSAHASLLCSASISLERLILVYFPFRASGYTKKVKIFVVVLIWLIGTTPQIVTAHHCRLVTLDDGTKRCEFGIIRTLSFYIWIEAIQCIAPSATIIISYSLVFIKLCVRKKSKIVLKHSTSKDSHAIDKLQLMLVVDAIFTLIAWLPQDIYSAWLTYGNVDLIKYSMKAAVLEASLAALTCVNAFSTPIIYFAFNKYFRMDVKELFQKVFCWRSTQQAKTAPPAVEANAFDATSMTVLTSDRSSSNELSAYDDDKKQSMASYLANPRVDDTTGISTGSAGDLIAKEEWVSQETVIEAKTRLRDSWSGDSHGV